MANTLTDLIPDLYVGLDVVSRELTGMIPAVQIDADVSRAAVNQIVRSFVAPASSASDITPGVVPPDDGDQSILNRSITITKSRRVPIRWNGEEDRAVGPNPGSIRQQQIQQALRTLVNEIETDLYVATALNASRNHTTLGTLPFDSANDWNDAAQTRKILVDNGAPLSDMQMVIDTATGATMRAKQAAVNTYGSDQLIRQGVLLDIGGMSIRESFAVSPLSGQGQTSATTLTLDGPQAAGDTAIAVSASGDDNIFVKGDKVSFGDAYEYVVAESVTLNNGESGVINIQEPGLAEPLAGGESVASMGAHVSNVAFNRGAVILAQRLPSVPEGGDLAQDRATITDPRSGLSFEIAMYPQYRQMQWEISAAWGVGVVKPEHVASMSYELA